VPASPLREWIQSICRKALYPLYYQRSESAGLGFAENLAEEVSRLPDADRMIAANVPLISFTVTVFTRPSGDSSGGGIPQRKNTSGR
jgi:hypothetical protein